MKKLDDKKRTCDSGISAVFQVTNISSRNDLHRRESQIDTMPFWLIYLIVTLIPSKFLFVMKWYRLRLNQNNPDRAFIKHDNGFPIINTRLFEPVGEEPCVLPIQYEKVFYLKVPHKPSWSFVVRHDPRGRPIKYNAIEEEDIKEEEKVEDDVDDDHNWELVEEEDEEEDNSDVATNHDDDEEEEDDEEDDDNSGGDNVIEDDDLDDEMDEE